MKGSQFLTYIRPLVEVLKNSGGSGNTSEIIDKVIDYMQIPDEVVEETIPSGMSRVRNQIQWARYYLAKAGLIDSSRRGVWQLTDKGYEADLSDKAVYDLFQKVLKTYRQGKKETVQALVDETEEVVVEDESHGETLLEILRNLTPQGFERICKRLLTEVGIHDVQITGASRDLGIDGTGVIKVNEVVGFNIIFQCKRYRDTVGPHHIRDFRGTMQGRADKGIILTTGRFTAEARREAVRDGVPPIELIDGDRLVTLFEQYKLGLKPRLVFDVVPEFFEQFN